EAKAENLCIAPVSVSWADEKGGAAHALREGQKTPLAFDHEEILGATVKRLRGKLNYTKIAFSLLPEKFTLRDLQTVHEAILDDTLNKPAFRRRMLDTGWLHATGERESASAFRPAELYQLKTAPNAATGE
ncbi:MAG: NUDIX hydrolase, partial [Pseudomonadota bacterium]